MRLSPGTTWVSHLLQRVTHAVVTDPSALALIERAGVHYAERNAAFAALLTDRGLATSPATASACGSRCRSRRARSPTG